MGVKRNGWIWRKERPEVGRRCPVENEGPHGLVLDLVHIESQRPHGYPHHRLRVVEEFYRLGVQREIFLLLVEEKLQRVSAHLPVRLQRQKEEEKGKREREGERKS